MNTATTGVATPDERTLERAAKTAAAYRALADAIEADPALAPGYGASFTFYAPYDIGSEKTFFAAARRLLPNAPVEVDDNGTFAIVRGTLAGEQMSFKAYAHDVMVKRTAVREVDEWVLDEVES